MPIDNSGPPRVREPDLRLELIGDVMIATLNPRSGASSEQFHFAPVRWESALKNDATLTMRRLQDLMLKATRKDSKAIANDLWHYGSLLYKAIFEAPTIETLDAKRDDTEAASDTGDQTAPPFRPERPGDVLKKTFSQSDDGFPIIEIFGRWCCLPWELMVTPVGIADATVPKRLGATAKVYGMISKRRPALFAFTRENNTYMTAFRGKKLIRLKQEFDYLEELGTNRLSGLNIVKGLKSSSASEEENIKTISSQLSFTTKTGDAEETVKSNILFFSCHNGGPTDPERAKRNMDRVLENPGTLPTSVEFSLQLHDGFFFTDLHVHHHSREIGIPPDSFTYLSTCHPISDADWNYNPLANFAARNWNALCVLASFCELKTTHASTFTQSLFDALLIDPDDSAVPASVLDIVTARRADCERRTISASDANPAAYALKVLQHPHTWWING